MRIFLFCVGKNRFDFFFRKMFSQMFAKRISFGLISIKQQPIRGYAKKTKGKSKLKAEPEIPPSDALDLTKYTNSMIKSVDWFKQELGGMALGRASPGNS